MKNPIVLVAVVVGVMATDIAQGAETKDHKVGIYLGSVRFNLSSIYESNIDREIIARDDFGVEVVGSVRLQSHRDRPLLWIEYRGGREEYANSNTWDRMSHRARAAIAGNVTGGLEAELFGDFTTKPANDDRELVNQVTVSPEIALKGSGSRRARLYGAYRSKDYVDTPERKETIWYAGLDLRRRVWGRSTLEIGYRYESADSRTAADSYRRHRIEGEWKGRLGARNQLTLGLQFRSRRYPDELVVIDGSSRRDSRWIPSLRLSHYLVSGQEFRLDYEYQNRSSNDPDSEYEAHQVVLGVRWTLFR